MLPAGRAGLSQGGGWHAAKWLGWWLAFEREANESSSVAAAERIPDGSAAQWGCMRARRVSRHVARRMVQSACELGTSACFSLARRIVQWRTQRPSPRYVPTRASRRRCASFRHRKRHPGTSLTPYHICPRTRLPGAACTHRTASRPSRSGRRRAHHVGSGSRYSEYSRALGAAEARCEAEAGSTHSRGRRPHRRRQTALGARAAWPLGRRRRPAAPLLPPHFFAHGNRRKRGRANTCPRAHSAPSARARIAPHRRHLVTIIAQSAMARHGVTPAAEHRRRGASVRRSSALRRLHMACRPPALRRVEWWAHPTPRVLHISAHWAEPRQRRAAGFPFCADGGRMPEAGAQARCE